MSSLGGLDAVSDMSDSIFLTRKTLDLCECVKLLCAVQR